MLRHEARHLRRVAVGVVVDQNPHHVLRAQLVLGRELAVVPRGVDQQHLVAALGRALLAQDQQAGGHAGPVEDVERQRDHGVDQPRLEQRLADQVLVVGLAALHLRVAVVVELARLLLDLGLAAEEHALRADDAGAAVVGERGEDVQDEGVVAVAGGRRLEAGAAAEAAERVLEALLAEDLLLELVLLLLVVRLLLRLQPPELVGEREIGEHERELLHPPVFEELRVGDRARAGLDVGLEAVQHGVDLADGGVAPVHLLREVAGAGGVVAVLAQVVGRVHQHAARAGGRVVDRVARARLEDAHERVDDLRRGEELARLGARVVGELLDEVLVGAAEHVGRNALVREVVLVEVLDERVDDLVRDERLAASRRARAGSSPR